MPADRTGPDDTDHPPTDSSPTDSEGQGLRFPEVARLELDQLLEQLVSHAREVRAAQGRLRGLVRAQQAITHDLGLAVVLRRIAEAARDLVGARYAALGVIDPDDGLSEFVHVGMAPPLVERIGRLPQGKGLLGALIDDPQPIRIPSIADDPRSSGFPAGHPPMSCFLGVPIRVRGEVFGNLYLAESTRGQFTADDEELTLALAASAGVAIENARLYDAARARQEWLQAATAITRRMLAEDLDHPLELIAESSRRLADADTVAIVRADAAHEDLYVDVAIGHRADDLTGQRLPSHSSVCGHVLRTGEPLHLARADDAPGMVSVASADLDIGPLLAVPLQGTDHLEGVLVATRLRGRPAFTAEEVDMATGFANQAAIATELATARAERQRSAMHDERDRIADELHTHVIRELFAIGLSLHGVAASVGPERAAGQIREQIAQLDATISTIRTTVFRAL